MKKKTLYFIVSLLLLSHTIFSQTIESEVFSTAGNHYSTPTLELSWTIGEVIVECFSSNKIILDQGFHRSNQVTVTNIYDVTDNPVSIKIYPNPASDKIYLDISDPKLQLQTTIYDLSGKMIETEIFTNSNTYILDISHLPAGTFLFTIHNSKTKELIQASSIIKVR